MKWGEEINTEEGRSQRERQRGCWLIEKQVRGIRWQEQEMRATMWSGPSPDGNRPPGREATLLAEQVTLGGENPLRALWKTYIRIGRGITTDFRTVSIHLERFQFSLAMKEILTTLGFRGLWYFHNILPLVATSWLCFCPAHHCLTLFKSKMLPHFSFQAWQRLNE